MWSGHNGQASDDMAAGLTLPAEAVMAGNKAATLEPRAMHSWFMAAPLLLSAPPRAGKLLQPGAEGTRFSALEQAFCKRSSTEKSSVNGPFSIQGPEERRARVRERRVPSRRATLGKLLFIR